MPALRAGGRQAPDRRAAGLDQVRRGPRPRPARGRRARRPRRQGSSPSCARRGPDRQRGHADRVAPRARRCWSPTPRSTKRSVCSRRHSGTQRRESRRGDRRGASQQATASTPRREAARAARGRQPGAARRAAGRRRRRCHPGHGVAATSTTSAPSRCGSSGGEAVYAIPELPKDQRAPDDHLRRVFGDWVVEVAASANLVVLRTPPGSAHVVGSALDRAGSAGVLGTVAGDDTLIVVVAEARRRRDVADAPARPRRPGMTARTIRRSRTEKHERGEASGAGLQRRPRHVGGRPLDDRGARRRGRSRCAVDVGQAGDDWDVVHEPGPRRRRDRGRRRRRSRGVRRGLRGAGAQGQRAVRGPLPAGVGAVPAGDREAPRRGGPRARRRRGRPRLHRQGQRPGPLRGLDPGARARPRGDRPGARAGG